MDTSTIALICSIVLCVIGVATFVGSMLTKARQDGQLITKMDFCMSGIEDIKKDLLQHKQLSSELQLSIAHHDEQIHTLYNRIQSVEERLDNIEKQ